MSKQPPRPRKGEPITLVTTARGEARYRTVLDYAPPGQARQQRRATFSTLTKARRHVASVKSRRESGALPTRDRDTFGRFADEFLAHRQPRVRPITYGTYVSALAHAREAFGEVPVGGLSAGHVESLVRAMADGGLSRRSVSLTLGLVRAVLARAVRQGASVRNVAEGIEPLGGASKARSALSVPEYREVAKAAAQHRLAAAWTLTLAGMRRSEVLGLRWQDLDMTHGKACLTVRNGRTGDGRTLTPPKTRSGARTLPLTEDMAQALRAWRSHLGETLGLVTVQPDAFVVVDEAGLPVRPERYSDEWVGLCRSTGIQRRVLLHEARHTSVTVMRASGVPDRIVAAWHGHDETIMRRTYDHAASDREALAEAAESLAALRKTSA